MSKKSTRERIIEVADRLFYQQGFEYSSFSDIADGVGISRGNFYYHFKTKDEILDAVIARRISVRNTMLERWEIEGEFPEDRIASFINILNENCSKIKRYGCPIGTLCSELAKLNHSSQAGAGRLFTLFRVWLRRQFVELGRRADADELAMYLLARSQGVATLGNAFNDEKYIRREVKQMHDWLKTYVPTNR